MVNFQVVSDLHIESYFTNKLSIKPVADILILAGDVCNIHKYNKLERFLSDVCKNFKHVIYVLGNHEYYHVKNRKHKTMDELIKVVLEFEKKFNNLSILDRNSLIIEDVCIVGCTLWSKINIDIPSFIVRIYGMNSYIYNNLHDQDVNYIKNMIEYCEKNEYKMVVVTHHCPTYSLLSKKKLLDKYKSLYASNLDYLFDGKKIHTWISGHIHINYDVIKNGTRLIGNQRGKPKDKISDFIDTKIIRV